MAKTNPIGVRFNADLLKKIMEEQGLTSPQKVLNFLEGHYMGVYLKNDANALRTHKEEPKKENIPGPNRKEMPRGLSLDQRIEWMEKNQKDL